MKNTAVRVAAVVAAVASLTAACGGGGGGKPTAAAPGSVKTVDELHDALKAAGLCAKTTPPTTSGALTDGSRAIPKITKTFYCDDRTPHALQISGFATAADRNMAASEQSGDGYHYAGTGDNLWIVEVDYDQGEKPVEKFLGSQVKHLY